LKGTIHYTIQYGRTGNQSIELQGYSDADYAGDPTNRCSVTGHIFMLNNGPVTWCSTKQRCVATSTTKSEYIALSNTSKQAQWIRALLKELQYTQYLGNTLEVPIFSDNQGCIALAKDPIAHSQTKHIDVRYHYIRQLVTFGKVTVKYISTKDMVADILTKPLRYTVFYHFIQGLFII
jgi:hypothetical protein